MQKTQGIKRLIKQVVFAFFCCILLRHEGQAVSVVPQPTWYWGVANAAFQVEGSPADSDWRRWTQTPGRIADGSNAQVTTDFWNRFTEDFDLAKTMGANMFRFSLAWDRIEPKPGVFAPEAMARYVTMCKAAQQRKLEPLITLHHFVLPGWLADAGGVLAPDFSSRFTHYVQYVAQALRSGGCNASYFVTFNEPMVMLVNGYVQGTWPPGHQKDFGGLVKGAAAVARAHIRGAAVLRRLLPYAQVSVASHWRHFQPQTKGHPFEWIMAKILHSGFNEQFIAAVTTGHLHFSTVGAWPLRDEEPLPQGRSSLDYFALNYYGRVLVKSTLLPPFYEIKEGPGEKSDLGWEIYPQGLEAVITDIYNLTKLPLLITENGLADEQDIHRSSFLREHIAALLRCRDKKIPLMGYLHWSLTDNFEWAFGMTPRFGLAAVEQQSLRRMPRPSFYEFQRIIHNGL